MKKAILSLLVALPLCDASAQYKLHHNPIEAPNYRAVVKRSAIPTPFESGTANKTAAAQPRWYNHAQALGTANTVNIYTDALTSYLPLWPDSTVRYVETGGATSAFGINWQSAAETFSPNTTLYNANNTVNRGKLRIATETYKIDSVMIRGVYDRKFTYNDTLILTFVADSTAGKFAYLSFGGNTAANHGIDSAAMLLWSAADYQQRPLNQVSYNYTGNVLQRARQVKVPLTNQMYLDSLTDGTHLIKAPVNITVPNGGKISMSVTYKPGTTWTSGSPITNYNAFYLMSHEIDEDGFVFYPATDQNMSYLAYKDSTNNDVNATLYYYIPTIAYNGTGTANFNSELHDISWLASCVTCQRVSVNDVNNLTIGKAYPNPASKTLEVPVSVKTATTVNVSLSNVLGQVLKTQELGNIATGQTKKAKFDISNLANGVYIYTVESEGNRTSDRVIIAH
jgi:hypothetical protein